jgi:hypothetical protein
VTEATQDVCCVCGIALPNRYARAGRCGESGCEALFCDLHWRRGNRRCPAHGWKPQDDSPPGGASVGEWAKVEKVEKDAENEEEPSAMEKSNVGKVRAALQWMKSKLWKDSGAMRRNLEERLAANRGEVEKNDAEERRLYEAVCAAKAEYVKAAPVRQGKLKMDLTALVARHKSCLAAREILLENDAVLTKALAAMAKVATYDGRGLSARDLDRIMDEVERSSEDADHVALAVGELDTAGKRTVRLAEAFDLNDELAGYGERTADASSGLEADLAGYGDAEPAPRPAPKQTAEPQPDAN